MNSPVKQSRLLTIPPVKHTKCMLFLCLKKHNKSSQGAGGFLLPPAKSFFIAVFLMTILFMFGSCDRLPQPAVSAGEYSDDEIADAIYLAEGETKAIKPFGILSVKCEGYDDCRQVCLNTIRNNRKRYADYGYKQYDTYLEFLWHRYAPPEVHPLNKNWLKNVRYFLEREK